VVPYRERCPVGDHSFDLLSGRCTAKTETESRPFRSQVRLPWRDRTGDNSTDPAWQAEPVDAATPGKPQNLCTNLCHAADVERVGQPFDRMAAAQSAALPPVSQAMDLIALTAKAADVFLEQTAAEQRKLLRLVLEDATWKGGEVADVVSRTIFAIKTFEPRNSHQQRGLRNQQQRF
jgi:hypothetical protein